MTWMSFLQGGSRWRRRIGVAGASLALPLALMVGAGSAQAQTPEYSVGLANDASLQLTGQAVILKTYVTCPAGVAATLHASLAQRVNKTTVINAQSERPVYCRGSSQKTFISLLPATAYVPLSYRSGDALASAYVYYCDYSGTGNCYSSATTTRTVSVGTTSFASYTDSAPRITATLGKTGKLRASGAGATVPVTITCANLSSAGAQVTLFHTLKQNGALDSGYMSPVTCNVQRRVIQVLLVVGSNGNGQGIPFVAGSAFAMAGVSACDNDGSNCQSVAPQGTVTLVH